MRDKIDQDYLESVKPLIRKLMKRAQKNGMVKHYKEAWKVPDSSVDGRKYLKGKYARQKSNDTRY